MNYLALDIGGTQIKYSLINKDLVEIEGTANIVTTKKEPEAFLKQILDICSLFQCNGVGISIGGFINRETGENKDYSVGKNFITYNLKKEIEEYKNLPVAIENDSNCALMAEMEIGNGKGLTDVSMITIGTGIGGAMAINGKIYRGHNFKSGEFGFMAVSYNEKMEYAGATSNLVKDVSRAINKEVDGKWIFNNLQEEEIKKIYDKWLYKLAINIGNVAVAFDFEKILIGGAISNNPIFMEDIVSKVYQLFPLKEYTIIEKCFLGNDAGKIGGIINLLKDR